MSDATMQTGRRPHLPQLLTRIGLLAAVVVTLALGSPRGALAEQQGDTQMQSETMATACRLMGGSPETVTTVGKDGYVFSRIECRIGDSSFSCVFTSAGVGYCQAYRQVRLDPRGDVLGGNVSGGKHDVLVPLDESVRPAVPVDAVDLGAAGETDEAAIPTATPEPTVTPEPTGPAQDDDGAGDEDTTVDPGTDRPDDPSVVGDGDVVAEPTATPTTTPTDGDDRPVSVEDGAVVDEKAQEASDGQDEEAVQLT